MTAVAWPLDSVAVTENEQPLKFKFDPDSGMCRAHPLEA